MSGPEYRRPDMAAAAGALAPGPRIDLRRLLARYEISHPHPDAWLWMTRRVVGFADVVERLRRDQPGTWREVVSLRHEEVDRDGWTVPLFDVETARSSWRRRKWWGPVGVGLRARIWMPMWEGRPFTPMCWIGTPRYSWAMAATGMGRCVVGFSHYVPPEDRL